MQGRMLGYFVAVVLMAGLFASFSAQSVFAGSSEPSNEERDGSPEPRPPVHRRGAPRGEARIDSLRTYTRDSSDGKLYSQNPRSEYKYEVVPGRMMIRFRTGLTMLQNRNVLDSLPLPRINEFVFNKKRARLYEFYVVEYPVEMDPLVVYQSFVNTGLFRSIKLVTYSEFFAAPVPDEGTNVETDADLWWVRQVMMFEAWEIPSVEERGGSPEARPHERPHERRRLHRRTEPRGEAYYDTLAIMTARVTYARDSTDGKIYAQNPGSNLKFEVVSGTMEVWFKSGLTLLQSRDTLDSLPLLQINEFIYKKLRLPESYEVKYPKERDPLEVYQSFLGTGLFRSVALASIDKQLAVPTEGTNVETDSDPMMFEAWEMPSAEERERRLERQVVEWEAPPDSLLPRELVDYYDSLMAVYRQIDRSGWSDERVRKAGEDFRRVWSGRFKNIFKAQGRMKSDEYYENELERLKRICDHPFKIDGVWHLPKLLDNGSHFRIEAGLVIVWLKAGADSAESFAGFHQIHIVAGSPGGWSIKPLRHRRQVDPGLDRYNIIFPQTVDVVAVRDALMATGRFRYVWFNAVGPRARSSRISTDSNAKIAIANDSF